MCRAGERERAGRRASYARAERDHEVVPTSDANYLYSVVDAPTVVGVVQTGHVSSAGMAVGIPYTRYHVVSTRRDGNIHNLVSACKNGPKCKNE